MALLLVTAPETACITLTQAKSHIRVDASDDDVLIQGLIDAAQSHIDSWAGRQIMPATWDMTLCQFPPGKLLRIPRPPLIEVTSISYRGPDGSSESLSLSNVSVIDRGEMPSRIIPLAGAEWPATDGREGGVTIRFRAGYEPAASSPPLAATSAVPPAIKTAALLLVGHWYAMREETDSLGRASAIPSGVDALLTPFRVWGF